MHESFILEVKSLFSVCLSTLSYMPYEKKPEKTKQSRKGYTA